MREIRKVHEALLAQHFEDVDRLAEKISQAADKVERATATLNAIGGKPRVPLRHSPAPRIACPVPTRWRGSIALGALLAVVVTSAGVAAWVSRNQPIHTPEQERAAEIGSAVVRAWPKLDPATQTRIWNALGQETREALARSVPSR